MSGQSWAKFLLLPPLRQVLPRNCTVTAPGLLVACLPSWVSGHRHSIKQLWARIYLYPLGLMTGVSLHIIISAFPSAGTHLVLHR